VKELPVQLINQRTQTECAIASVAMAFKLDYDYVLNIAYISNAKDNEDTGTHTHSLLNALKAEYRCVYDHNKKMGPGAWRDILCGRRAILSVDSLNIESGKHALYWNYNEVLDPQNGNVVNGEPKKFFTSLDDMQIETAYILCECGSCEPKQKWKIERINA
jgi:hypothetical protein